MIFQMISLLFIHFIVDFFQQDLQVSEKDNLLLNNEDSSFQSLKGVVKKYSLNLELAKIPENHKECEEQEKEDENKGKYDPMNIYDKKIK